MAFDAGMLRAVVRETARVAVDGKVEKIYQPDRDEIVFIIRARGQERHLLVNSGSSCPRMCLTEMKPENPATPPMFCMMLRKHFSGARLSDITQPGFERIAFLTFDTKDDMGFPTQKRLIVESMGKYSNVIVTDRDDKIIGILKPIDFSASTVRQLLPGMKYTLPPARDMLEPEFADRDSFNRAARSADPDMSAVKFISSTYRGIAAVTAREIVFRASGNTSSTLTEAGDKLFDSLCEVVSDADNGGCRPSLIRDENGTPKEYCFTELRQYGVGKAEIYPSVSALIDDFYLRRAADERLLRRASDIFRILSAAEVRITKKIALQREELDKCEEGDKFKKWADLITGNIYMMKRGQTSVTLSDWYSEGEDVTIPLSERMTPSQNAQFYYKKYNKSKSAKIHLAEQIENAEKELIYIDSVFDVLTRASTERELSEIRDELYHSGYASKMRNYTEKKKQAPLIVKYHTRDSHTVLCGKNNIANDHLTMKTADKNDWWFHVKDAPGAHVVLVCADGEAEPSEETFTEAAMIAAYNSQLTGGVNVPVDYTKVRYVKKPAGSKPGFVIYSTNYTAYVTPDEKLVKSMETKKI